MSLQLIFLDVSVGEPVLMMHISHIICKIYGCWMLDVEMIDYAVIAWI